MFFNMKTVDFKTLEELYQFVSTHTEKEHFPEIGDFYRVIMTFIEFDMLINSEKKHVNECYRCKNTT